MLDSILYVIGFAMLVFAVVLARKTMSLQSKVEIADEEVEVPSSNANTVPSAEVEGRMREVIDAIYSDIQKNYKQTESNEKPEQKRTIPTLRRVM
jgi:hypothetical protein